MYFFKTRLPKYLVAGLFFVFSGMALNTLYAQNYQSIEEVNDACTQLGFMGDEDAEIAVENILSQIGLLSNFTLQECPNINNAVAKNIDMGSGFKERYILYDREFFNRIEDKAANDWAATSILAHEIGHHLGGHALNDEGSNHKWELEADQFSGFVLARMGSTLIDAQSAISTLQYEKATRTHPAKKDRLIAIEKGWSRGKGKTITVTENTDESDDKVINIKPLNVKKEDKSKITALQILENHIKAVGGEERAMQIRSLFQKIKMTTKSNINGEEILSEMNMDITYQTPSRYKTEMDFNGVTYYTLNIDGKTYSKSGNDTDWKFSNQNNVLKNQVSFVWEYSMLVNNEDVKYLGKKTVKGVECYAIELPSLTSDQDQDVFSMKSTSNRVSYYEVSSGLLKFTISDSHTVIDYKENSEYLKDSDTKSFTTMEYTDYKRAGGVLFPGKLLSETTGASDSEMVMEFEEIRVNPEINKADFRVKI